MSGHQPAGRQPGGSVPIALRPLEFGEILDWSIELYRRNLSCFLGIYAVAAVPYLCLAAPLSVFGLTGSPGPAGGLDLGRQGLAAVAGLALFLCYTGLVAPVVSGAMTVAVSERFLGRPASIRAAYRRVWSHAWPLVGTLGALALPLLGVLLLVMTGATAAAIGGLLWLGGDELELTRVVAVATALTLPASALVMLLFLVWCGFVPAAVVLEERGFRALGRSLELVRGRFWRVAGVFALLFAMVVVMATYIRLPTQLLTGAAGLAGGVLPALLGTLAMQLGVLLVDPIRLVGVTLTYYDLRMRGEGFDLALLADELAGAGR